MPAREAARNLCASYEAWREQDSGVHNHPAREVLGQIGDKWSSLVIITLSQHPKRFGELKREIPGISQRVLTQTLRQLEMNGLLNRYVFPTRPPNVEYSLTPLGESFLIPLWSVTNWADIHHPKIQKARKRFLSEGK